jgi:hypothetical protein
VTVELQGPGSRLLRRARTTAVAWLGHAELTVDEWQRFGPRIGLLSKSTNWWLGDWVRFGQRRYDQRYRAAAELTGYDEQTLMNLAYVANRFAISRRRETLSWSHHAEVAKLESESQDFWLNRAEQDQLSVRKLRTQIREAERRLTRSEPLEEMNKPAAGSPGPHVVCPHCGGAVPVGADYEGLIV